MPDIGIPMGQWSGADATDRLRQTMIDLSKTTEAQTKWLVRLTWVLVVMTAVLVVLTVILVVNEL